MSFIKYSNQFIFLVSVGTLILIVKLQNTFDDINNLHIQSKLNLGDCRIDEAY